MQCEALLHEMHKIQLVLQDEHVLLCHIIKPEFAHPVVIVILQFVIYLTICNDQTFTRRAAVSDLNRTVFLPPLGLIWA